MNHNASDLSLPATIVWDAAMQTLQLLDQRVLPGEIRYWQIESLHDAWQAINTLAVRGAPAIGVAAAYALAQAAQEQDGPAAWQEAADYLKSARPTAVNLAWAVDRVMGCADEGPAAMAAEAAAIHAEDVALCRAIGEHGAGLIKAGAGVLTHCNAGALATTGAGTATAPMYVQHAKAVPFKVYVDETRPLYQGARLTAWELSRAGIDATLICDNMAATHMAAGHIQMAIVGTDRVTANGDVVNKIGTLNVAILCQHFGIPFYVACPSSTYDPDTTSGDQVEIEQRIDSEVRGTHAADVAVSNPAFDVTPANLVTAIITEFGLVKPAEISSLLGDLR